ncbi:hypothetical protein L596_003074 [Steinernema carpocapsae]|uniref:Uncharacterized protein n=1 Tax=Steinernema carpocapsae TaxID=34508 RepID=A0A4U8URF7_STECR|nr:hypothetical protein L596_003074 [Steinernema carpocapsae]
MLPGDGIPSPRSDAELELWEDKRDEELSEISSEEECSGEREVNGMSIPVRFAFLEVLNMPSWKARTSAASIALLKEQGTQVFLSSRERFSKHSQTKNITLESL